MTKQTLKHLAVSCAFLGLALNTSPTMAQSKQTALTRFDTELLHLPEDASRATDRSQISSPSYTFTLLDFPTAPSTVTAGINSGVASSNMQIAGWAGPGAPSCTSANSFVLRFGETKSGFTENYRRVNFPKSTCQAAAGVNDFGQIVGYEYDSLGNAHGYEFSKGKYTAIDVPFAGATFTETTGINNSGVIVGNWYDKSGVSHGFQLSGGVYTSFDFPGATLTEPIYINNGGDIAGLYVDSAGTSHGFLLSSLGTYTSIDVPGAAGTQAYGINDGGEIVGFTCTASDCLSGTSQGFLLSSGVFTTISVPNANQTLATDINNKGVIVGFYFDCAGMSHGFIATP